MSAENGHLAKNCPREAGNTVPTPGHSGHLVLQEHCGAVARGRWVLVLTRRPGPAASCTLPPWEADTATSQP